jgi:hypothetical protein
MWDGRRCVIHGSGHYSLMRPVEFALLYRGPSAVVIYQGTEDTH